MKNLNVLQAECEALGIKVDMKGRASKEPYIAGLREYHWRKDHPHELLPAQIRPMLLGAWEDLDDAQADAIEQDHHAWLVEPKMDGVRALFHIDAGCIRITSRTISEVTYRLSELQENLPHLTQMGSRLRGTILDGELVCPVSSLNTGSTTAATSLQATMAILAASPDKAQRIQESQDAHLRYHVFDILRYCGQDVTAQPLRNRKDLVETAVREMNNSHVEAVPSFVVNKSQIHLHIIDEGGEGTVWKRVDGIYEPNRRVRHWIKRKRGTEVEALVTGIKPGTNGHTGMVGAVEFSIRKADGSTTPVAWVSGWSDEDRRRMTRVESNGEIALSHEFISRRALIVGQDRSAKADRLRHARLVKWLDP